MSTEELQLDEAGRLKYFLNTEEPQLDEAGRLKHFLSTEELDFNSLGPSEQIKLTGPAPRRRVKKIQHA